MTTHISYGHEREITVPLLNLWTVWWNADRAAAGFRGYWNAPIFFPTQKTLVFSEAQPTSIVVAPILGLTGNRALAYNCYQLLILSLNGFSAHRLLRRLGHIPWLALCGGVMSQILPFVMWQFGVVQLTTLFGVYWTLHAVCDLFHTSIPDPFPTDSGVLSDEIQQSDNRPCLKMGCSLPLALRLGLAYGVTYWLCNYWGLFLTLLLVPSSIWLWNRRLMEWTFWRDVICSALVAVAMIGPFAWLQRNLSREHDWHSSRTSDLVHNLSAHWRDHTDVPWYTFASWLECPEPLRETIWPLGGGGIKLLLVPVGFIAGVISRRRRRWALFSITFGALAFGLSLGPTIRIAEAIPIVSGICPYEVLQKYVPGFSLIRSPFRFAMFVQLAAVWLSVEALDLLNPLRWMQNRVEESNSTKSSFKSIAMRLFGQVHGQRISIPAVIPLVLVSGLVTLEAIPPKTRLYELPSKRVLPSWVLWLRDDAEPNTAIACLPFPTGYNVDEYEETTIWMFWSTFHRRPLVNGYSGFFPDSFMKMKEGLELFQRPSDLGPNDAFQHQFKHYSWDNPGLKLLNECPIRYAVVKRSFATQNDIWAHPATRFRWALVASDETSMIDVYQVRAPDE